MTPPQFIAQWRPANLSERSAAQQHFLDLCELLNQPQPVEADPEGAWYTFEQAVQSGQVNVPDVTGELVKTLAARVSAEFFVPADLDPARLTTALRDARPVEQGTFNAGELAFYHQALEEAVRYLVSTASTLPRFQESVAAESLTRLTYEFRGNRRLSAGTKG